MNKTKLVELNGKLAAAIAAKKAAIKELEIKKLEAQKAQIENALIASSFAISKRQAAIQALLK